MRLRIPTTIALLTVLIALAQVSESAAPAPLNDCTKDLNTEIVPTHCAGTIVNCEGTDCCDHEHQMLTYNKLITPGGQTGKKAGLSTSKYYSYKTWVCDDHDEDEETADTCEWPFPSTSQDGPMNNPTHHVVNWTVVDC